MSVEFEGLNELIIKMEKIGKLENLTSAIEKSCSLVERDAKQKAPKQTGALKRSIESKVEESDASIQGVVFTPLEYAPYVEYGTGLFAENGGRQSSWRYKDDEGNYHTTSGQKPQPFLRPALQENKENIIKLLKDGLLND